MMNTDTVTVQCMSVATQDSAYIERLRNTLMAAVNAKREETPYSHGLVAPHTGQSCAPGPADIALQLPPFHRFALFPQTFIWC